ncbi:MAG TPA: kelch repeat-containing protein [Chitinophagaceae bacterium]|nr:kelch repeat-containing protein [Chitinophagaceae bacterium]
MKKITRQLLCCCLLPFCILVAGGDGQWRIVATRNAIPNRGECGMAAWEGKLYLVGGGALPTQVYNPAGASWSEKAAPPQNINHFQAVAYDKRVYVLSALTAGPYPHQPNIERPLIYDITTDKWSTGTPLPPERNRAAAGAAVYKGKLFLVAGIKEGHFTGTTGLFDQYDPVRGSWTPLPAAPHIRDHCSAAVLGDKLYVAGGRNTSYHEPENFMSFFKKTVLEVDCYDFKSGHWSTLASRLPLGSGGGALVAMDGKLYYMGGERATETEPNQPRKDCFWLDPVHDTGWKTTSALNEARNGMSAAVINNAIYVFGGAGPKQAPLPDGPLQEALEKGPPPKQTAGGPSPLEMFTLHP